MKHTEWIIHPSFYVFWAVWCLLDQSGYLWYFLLAALVHELGHAAAVLACGGEIRRIILYAAGACIQVHHKKGYPADIGIAAAGPLAGLLMAILCTAVGWTNAAGASLLLTLFNCLPILPLDGGCIAACALCMTPLGLRGYDGLRMVSMAGSAGLVVLGGVVLAETGTNAALLTAGMTLFLGNAGYSCKAVGSCV